MEPLANYNRLKALNLKLDMSRGKPSPEQLDLSLPLLAISDYKDDTGVDARNYSNLEGIPEARRFFAELQGVAVNECLVGGNSSLELMYHTVELLRNTYGKGKWLCPVPGYDRHFRVTEVLGYELISVPMTAEGPDMDEVERLARDPEVRGIWCVPKYSNPDGYTYSGEVCKRLANMSAAPGFTVIWDNAYGWHHIAAKGDELPNFTALCKAAGNPDRAVAFCSTSKITFGGAGVAAVSSSEANINALVKYFTAMTIGFDKLNQLRHVRFLKNEGGLAAHMEKHRAILAPKFQKVLDVFAANLPPEVAEWTKPNGGYFISLYLNAGKAAKTVQLCKEAGVILTPAGAAYPYGKDPEDRHIRVAPTYPSSDDLQTAAELLCVAASL
ncbi:MAG: aminotransferase class I/II-fold pyridoxal phosphate-dependent enzyme [Oscillospiraceae bacterium]|jgi:DNA-binding transcriptional MocR family regulator|nr:aminotransferase class I/II-fold pyridoxal phosphate-dependent enzyme [Oscillospiraceae bacterium]